jgi:aminoglycoside/choline kinase family phosphotransferase
MTQVPTPSAAEVTWESRARQSAFEAWLAPLADTLGLRPQTLRPASSDASFRRYLRIDGTGGSFIIMDAPPSHEDVRPFIAVADLIHQAGLHAPRVLAQDTQHGFLLLSDLGSTLYLAELRAAVSAEDTASIERLMRGAFSALVAWQQRVDASSLPAYDDALLRRELALFPEWCVRREFGVTWGADELATWATTTARNRRVTSPSPAALLDLATTIRPMGSPKARSGAVCRSGIEPSARGPMLIRRLPRWRVTSV